VKFVLCACFLLLTLQAQTLGGVIDIHAHYDPDLRPRSLDVISLAKLAKERGMRGLVLKNAETESVSVAWLARKAAPGLEVFGGVVLNRQVGGLNPAVIDYIAELKAGVGRIVWMPTTDAENAVRASKVSRPFVSVSAHGRLLPETLAVIDRIARHQLVLATGHSSAAECLLLIQEAKSRGIEHVVVTHAMQGPIYMNLEQLKQAAGMGAFLEFVVDGLLLPDSDLASEMGKYAALIRAVGTDHFVVASDLGQASNPTHPDGLLLFMGALRSAGFTPAEIDRMTKENPAILLGLQKGEANETFQKP
jgi:hypothetical protein